MSNYRLRVLIALCSGLVACDEHTALNATAEVDLRPAAITPNTVVLVLADAVRRGFIPPVIHAGGEIVGALS